VSQTDGEALSSALADLERIHQRLYRLQKSLKEENPVTAECIRVGRYYLREVMRELKAASNTADRAVDAIS
jgi:hypothetical protein